MDLREIRWGGMDRFNLVQGRDHWLALVNTVMKFWEIFELVGFSRRTQLHGVN
jgi:hypothetical protein